MPLGFADDLREVAHREFGFMPTLPKSSETTERSRTRITTLSPNIVGSTLTRKVDLVTTDRQFDASVLRQPALGDIQIGHHLDSRVVMAKARCRGGGTISKSTPSALMRMRNSSSNGSK